MKCNSSSKVLMVHKREGNTPHTSHLHPALECLRVRNGSQGAHTGRTWLEPSLGSRLRGNVLPIYPKQQPLEESRQPAMVLPTLPNLRKGLVPSYLSPGKREAAAWLPCRSPQRAFCSVTVATRQPPGTDWIKGLRRSSGQDG